MKMEMYCRDCENIWKEDEENERCYECPECRSDNVYRERFLECHCGDLVYCNSFTNECECCGALYNAFGQMLAPPDQWDDDDRYDSFGPQDY